MLARTERFLTAGEVHRRAGRWSVNGIRNAVVRLSTQGLVTAETSGPVPRYVFNGCYGGGPAPVEPGGQAPVTGQ